MCEVSRDVAGAVASIGRGRLFEPVLRTEARCDDQLAPGRQPIVHPWHMEDPVVVAHTRLGGLGAPRVGAEQIPVSEALDQGAESAVRFVLRRRVVCSERERDEVGEQTRRHVLDASTQPDREQPLVALGATLTAATVQILPLQRLYTLRELVEKTGISEKVLRRAIRAGFLRALQPSGPSGTLYIAENDYLAWLDSSAVEVDCEATVPGVPSPRPDIAFHFIP